MGTTLAILMVLGIFVGVPALIGFAIAGMYILSDRRVRRAERVKALEEAAGILVEQPAEVQGEAAVEEPANEGVPVTQR